MNLVNRNELLKRLPAFALLAAAAWLLVRIGLSAWELARPEPPAPLPARPEAVAGNSDARAPGSGLFGAPETAARPGGASERLLNRSDFRLRGVVASNRPNMAHAIIESGGISRAYFPGDAVAAGLTLHEVRPYEVRLQRGAEILRLPLSDLIPGRIRSPSPGRFAGLRNNIPDNILEAPARMSLSQILRMEPVMEDGGEMQGYRVFPGSQRGLFNALGLVSGDLVVAVNGIPIDSGNLPQAQLQMSAGGDMMLTVERGGEQLEVLVGSENFGLLAM